VFIDTSGPEFIGWDDINGIDEVKQEIEEIIDYLKNPGERSSCYVICHVTCHKPATHSDC
jgi:hypothetical protein